MPGRHIELINSTYLVIHEKQPTIPCDNFEFIKLFTKYMKNTAVYRDSEFNKLSPSANAVQIDENRICDEVIVNMDLKTDCLLEHEKILFELYFEQGLTLRKISEMCSGDGYRITKQSINSMVNTIKQKLKKYNYENA